MTFTVSPVVIPRGMFFPPWTANNSLLAMDQRGIVAATILRSSLNLPITTTNDQLRSILYGRDVEPLLDTAWQHFGRTICLHLSPQTMASEIDDKTVLDEDITDALAEWVSVQQEIENDDPNSE